MNRSILAILIFGMAFAAANARADEAKPNDSDKKPRRDECVFFSTLYDWRALDDTNLVLWAPNKRDAYHVVLTMPLIGLKFAHQLAFIDADNDRMLCGFSRDAIGSNEGGMPSKSTIRSMTRLDADGMIKLQEKYKVDLSRDRKKKIPKEPAHETAQ
jgi:hypothetical protein